MHEDLSACIRHLYRMRTRECKSQEFYTRSLKSRKVPVSFVISSVHLSFCTYQCGSQKKDFREIRYWRLLRKSVEKIYIWLKSEKISGTLPEDPTVCNIVRSDVCSAKVQRTHDCACMTRLRICITLFTATCVRQE